MAATKFVVGTLFCAVALCTLFAPPGPLNSAAWAAAVPLDLIVVGYYVRKKHFPNFPRLR